MELHENLPVHLKKVLEGKRIPLWKEVLEQLGHPSELDAPAWEETQHEVDQGWLRPCEVDDLREVHIARQWVLEKN